jgi:hypothetical protein
MKDASAEPARVLSGWAASRRLLASAIAAFAFGVALSAAAHRSIEDATLVFVDAPHHIVPDGHNAQVRLVKTVVPAGSTIFYIMDKPEAWQLGLWQRSLYPDYVVLPIQGLAQLHTAVSRQLRERNRIEYAISAGKPPIDQPFQWQVALPSYPNVVPTVFGKLQPE